MPRRPFAIFFALVWCANGLGCKILDLVPRHRAIVARILGDEHALLLTRAIGIGEIAMGLWVFFNGNGGGPPLRRSSSSSQ